MNGKRKDDKHGIIAGVQTRGGCSGKNFCKEFQGLNILCPEPQAWKILFSSIFNKKPLKDFKQELFSGLCLRKIYLAEAVR